MTQIEVIIFILLLLMVVPSLCGKIGYTALVYPVYIVAGIIFAALVDEDAYELLTHVGEFGFIFLLFTIGLEIEFPNKRESLTALRNASLWILAQVPALTMVGIMLGFDWSASLIAATALCACSVSMTYHVWQKYPHYNDTAKRDILLCMVALEILAMIIISSAFAKGGNYGATLLHLLGMVIAIVLVACCAQHLAKGVNRLLNLTNRWQVHFIALLVLVVAAIGERLGLSAPKMAFFFGLFISGATREGLTMERHLRPITQQLLIPIFFTGLGIIIPPSVIFSWLGLAGLALAASLLVCRYALYKVWWQRWLPGDRWAFLMVCPNLTIVAVAMKALIAMGVDMRLGQTLLITGLIMSVVSILLLPRRTELT